nr:15643_t:CDS:2 [Entrophospora candida]
MSSSVAQQKRKGEFVVGGNNIAKYPNILHLNKEQERNTSTDHKIIGSLTKEIITELEEIIEIEKEAIDLLKVSLKNIYDIFNRHFYKENEPMELPPNQWIDKLKEVDDLTPRNENINMDLASNENSNDIYDETDGNNDINNLFGNTIHDDVEEW